MGLNARRLATANRFGRTAQSPPSARVEGAIAALAASRAKPLAGEGATKSLTDPVLLGKFPAPFQEDFL